MASSSTEATPLLHHHSLPSNPPPKPRRTVTFDTHVSTNEASNDSPLPGRPLVSQSLGVPQSSTTGTDNRSTISSLNSKLRRRNSQGTAQSYSVTPAPKIGPQRTTKVAEKLKILPSPDHGDDGPDEESGRDVYAQFTRIKDPTARRDAARLGKGDRSRLPRVTAYCTAASYRTNELMQYLKGKARTRGTQPKLFDECIYTPYSYPEPRNSDPKQKAQQEQQDQQDQTDQQDQQDSQPRRFSDSDVPSEQQYRDSLIGAPRQNLDLEAGNGSSFYASQLPNFGPESNPPDPTALDFDIEVHTPEVFLFNYGTVVIWGMTLQQEKRFLRELEKFEVEKLSKDDVQTEDFNFYYTREYQARIYNDFISLMDKKNYMTKLAISHALSQSVKTSLYEDLVDGTIETTKEIPTQIALTGKVNLSRKEINMQIGELFILRINIHLQGSVLDAPELLWAEPQLDPVYQAVRSYLEMDQRVGLLTERLNVIADLLAVLKDQLTHTHGEYLEWIGSSKPFLQAYDSY
jgi:uncharacterized Rmd1/YagE family protein